MRKSLEAVHSAAVNALEGIEDPEKDLKKDKKKIANLPFGKPDEERKGEKKPG